MSIHPHVRKHAVLAARARRERPIVPSAISLLPSKHVHTWEWEFHYFARRDGWELTGVQSRALKCACGKVVTEMQIRTASGPQGITELLAPFDEDQLRELLPGAALPPKPGRR